MGKVRHALTAIAASLLACSTTHAQTPPLEFKGLRIGVATPEQLREKMPKFDCRNIGEGVSCLLSAQTVAGDCVRAGQSSACVEPYWFGPGLPEYFFVHFAGGKLVAVNLDIRGGTLLMYVEALKAKYGEPTMEVETIQNRMGAKFENAVYTWKLAEGEIRAERYYGGLSKSRIDLTAPGHDHASVAAKAAERVKASAKGL